MAESNKERASELFGKISSYKTIVQNELGKYLNKLSPYAKEYESSLDLVLDILRQLGHSEGRLIRDLLQHITGDANITAVIDKAYHNTVGAAKDTWNNALNTVDTGYHGAINSLEGKISELESKQNNDSFINKLDDAVKSTISAILTSFLTCSVSPFIPYSALDKVYKNKQVPGEITISPINIPTNILDYSNTLHVSPVSESGIYFYNTEVTTKFYRRKAEVTVETENTIAGVKDANAERYITYSYEEIVDPGILTDEEKQKFKKVTSVPRTLKYKEDVPPPDELVYIVRSIWTAESLYKTDDMNAFIWYVANRGDNYDETVNANVDDASVMYEYNKMAWDSRRMNKRVQDEARTTPEEWDQWLKSRTSWSMDDPTGDFKFEKPAGTEITTLFPILQFEPSEAYGHMEHIIATFPAQRYYAPKTVPAFDGDSSNDFTINITRSIYKFNSDYLKSIKLFNWKTIIMNMLYELNGISPIPQIRHNISLSDEIIDAKLSTLILNTIAVDDMEVDDSYYTFSNEDYSEALKRMELKKYGAKPYITAAGAAIQNPSGTAIDVMNSLATASTLNEVTTTITRGAYAVEGTSGSTGITKTTLSVDLGLESNFIYEILMAIVKPFVRALLSPQVMLLFCINLDVMGLINLKDLGRGDIDMVNDFIFRKISGIIKKLIVQIKDEIVRYLLEVVFKEIKKLVEEVGILILLEQLNDYIRLLNQIMECIRKFGIGTTVHGIDEVNYADIIPEANGPKQTQ